ncbi:hypothetical protein [Actinoallomurus vinaceus]|uniref:hypothetical protein n=1 Tax=Actinoallomurus vinaceus TaxID=1080074 RepID=UPI0031E51669
MDSELKIPVVDTVTGDGEYPVQSSGDERLGLVEQFPRVVVQKVRSETDAQHLPTVLQEVGHLPRNLLTVLVEELVDTPRGG